MFEMLATTEWKWKNSKGLEAPLPPLKEEYQDYIITRTVLRGCLHSPPYLGWVKLARLLRSQLSENHIQNHQSVYTENRLQTGSKQAGNELALLLRSWFKKRDSGLARLFIFHMNFFFSNSKNYVCGFLHGLTKLETKLDTWIKKWPCPRYFEEKGRFSESKKLCLWIPTWTD